MDEEPSTSSTNSNKTPISSDVPEFQRIKLRHVPKVKKRAPQPPQTLLIRKVCYCFFFINI